MKVTPLVTAIIFLSFTLTAGSAFAGSAAERNLRHVKCVAAHPVPESHEKCFVICDRVDKPELCHKALTTCAAKGLNVLHGMGRAIDNVQDCLDPLVTAASKR